MRVETGYAEGRDVTPHYDPMIAKVIVHARDARQAAIERLALALEAFDIQGPKTNIPAVLAVLRSEQFRAGDVHTGLIAEVLAQETETQRTMKMRARERLIERCGARAAARAALDELARQAMLAQLRRRRAEIDYYSRCCALSAKACEGLEPPFAVKVDVARHPAQERRRRREGRIEERGGSRAGDARDD